MSEPPSVLGVRDDHIEALRRSLSSAENGLGGIPNAIKVIVRDGDWRDRVIRQTGQRVEFGSFADFVMADPLEGLGATLDQLRGLCREDREALDAIDRATQHAPSLHRPAFDNVQGNEAPTGNSAAKALRRLRKDRPDLHARVLAGELSPHAAMIEAGFRPRTATVPLTVRGAVGLLSKLSDVDRGDVARVMGWAP